MNTEERKRLRELRGDTNLRWVKGDRVGEPSFITELDDSLPPEEFMAQTGGNVADYICHTDAEVVVEFFNSMPDLLDDADRLESENAALRARVEVLEEVRKAAEALCEQVEYVKYYTADSTALSAIRSALAAALEATDGSI